MVGRAASCIPWCCAVWQSRASARSVNCWPNCSKLPYPRSSRSPTCRSTTISRRARSCTSSTTSQRAPRRAWAATAPNFTSIAPSLCRPLPRTLFSGCTAASWRRAPGRRPSTRTLAASGPSFSSRRRPKRRYMSTRSPTCRPDTTSKGARSCTSSTTSQRALRRAWAATALNFTSIAPSLRRPLSQTLFSGRTFASSTCWRRALGRRPSTRTLAAGGPSFSSRRCPRRRYTSTRPSTTSTSWTWCYSIDALSASACWTRSAPQLSSCWTHSSSTRCCWWGRGDHARHQHVAWHHRMQDACRGRLGPIERLRALPAPNRHWFSR